MAFNPDTGLVYIPAIESTVVFWIPKEPKFVYQKGGINLGAVLYFPIDGAMRLGH